MANSIIVQYIGFEAKGACREYIFAVREADTGSSEYALTIENEAFEAHRARYQDGPDICSHRLRRELAANANHPPTNHFHVTDAELADYGNERRPKPARGIGFSRKD